MRYRIVSSTERMSEISEDLTAEFESVLNDYIEGKNGDDHSVRLDFDSVDEARYWLEMFRLWLHTKEGDRYQVRRVRSTPLTNQSETSFDVRIYELDPNAPTRRLPKKETGK